jgi:glycosyltransferase involved in cell wall biosynthesis
MLTISLDATALRPNPSGIGYYVYNLIEALYQLQSSENFQLNLFYQPSVKNWLRGNLSASEQLQNYPDTHCLPIPTTLSNLLTKFPNPALAYFEKYLQYPDIIHGTDHIVYPCQKSFKVMTIHDLTFIKYPEYVPLIVKTYTERIKRCLKWTDLIITMAETTKEDIVHHLQVNPHKIWVIPLASRYSVQENLKTSPTDEQPYILFVGTFEPRKNIKTLVLAFDYLKKKFDLPHRLVLIGKKGWGYESILKCIENSAYKKDIYHLNYLADELVAQFYQHAEVFVYPSFYEGFGLPVLEAMNLGTPVITSNVSSLPEVVDSAAITINPQDFIELAEAIFKVLSNDDLRKQLILDGRTRAQRFSWEKTAKQTLEAYYSLLT